VKWGDLHGEEEQEGQEEQEEQEEVALRPEQQRQRQR
jgi:hypothetical protein